MTRKRWLGLLVAALIVPLPAFALGGGSASASLDVSVSNGGCGIAGGSSVVCKLNVSFNAIDGASRYTASVIAPDGSVVDYGAIGAGGASIPVPYVGDGTYSVSVSAWGEKPSDRHAKPLATDTSGPIGHVRHTTATAGASGGTRGAVGRHANSKVSQASGSRTAGANAGGDASATVQPDTSTTGDTQQGCVQMTPAPTPPSSSGSSSGSDSGSTTTTATTPTPPPPTCPDGQPVPPNGCCPNP
jgi:hypothetical protein